MYDQQIKQELARDVCRLKVTFERREDARNAAKRLQAVYGYQMKVYNCSVCGSWHLATIKSQKEHYVSTNNSRDIQITKARQDKRDPNRNRRFTPPNFNFLIFSQTLHKLSSSQAIKDLPRLSGNTEQRRVTQETLMGLPETTSGGALYVVKALEFLGVIDIGGWTDPGGGHKLLEADVGTPAWGELLKPYVLNAYNEVFQSVDVATASEKRLREALVPLIPFGKDPTKYTYFFRSACKASRIPIRMTDVEQRAYDSPEYIQLLRYNPSDLPHGPEDYPDSAMSAALSQAGLRSVDDISDEPEDPVSQSEPQSPEPKESPVPTTPAPAGFRQIKKVVSEICVLLGDAANEPRILELMRSVMPGPEGLPSLPEWNPSWSDEVQTRWFEIYAMKLKAELEGSK